MKFADIFKNSVSELENLFHSSLDLLRVKGVKKSANFAGKLIFGLFFIFILSICILFWIVTLALFLGEMMGSYALSFLLMGAVPTLVFFALLIFRNKIKNRLRDIFVRLLMKEDE